MLCLCYASNFLYKQTALDLQTQEREGAKEGEVTLSFYFIYVSSPMKANVPM